MHATTDEDAGREETALERVDRNLAEFNGEARVVVTGVQVLFAFLLIVPFNAGFERIGTFDRAVYFVTLVLAALATVCVLAPAARHRVLFRQDDKPDLLATANRIGIAGLVFLALAMCGSLLLVTSKLFGVAAGGATVAAGALVFGTVWFGLPLRRRRRIAAAGRGARAGENALAAPSAGAGAVTASRRAG